MRRLLNREERPRIDPAAVKKILLIRLRRIGDVVMTTPALTLLRRNFPAAFISYIAEQPAAGLLDLHPALDELITIPRQPGTNELFSLIRSLRRQKYDVVFDLHGGPRAFLLSMLSGAGTRIGYRIKYKHIFYHITRPRRPEQGYFHSVENHVNLVNPLGIACDDIPPLTTAPPRTAETSRIEQLLQTHSMAEKKLICLHIGAGNRFRNWGIDNLKRLLALLAEQNDAGVVLVGAGDDRKTAAALLSRSHPRVLSLAGDLNLRELLALLKRAALFIGPDSGPMHIAAAAGIPMVVYFGPTLPAHFAPWKANAVILEKAYACRPCRQTECIYGDLRCLMDITPDEVYMAAVSQLDGKVGTS